MSDEGCHRHIGDDLVGAKSTGGKVQSPSPAVEEAVVIVAIGLSSIVGPLLGVEGV